jgi:hypothetical protein
MQQTTRTSECDFGVFDYEGTSIMFKTDYYDKELNFSLAWSRRSHRHRAGMITIMRIFGRTLQPSGDKGGPGVPSCNYPLSSSKL